MKPLLSVFGIWRKLFVGGVFVGVGDDVRSVSKELALTCGDSHVANGYQVKLGF